MRFLSTVLGATIATFSLAAQAVGQLAALSIFDRSTGRELPVYWHEGRPYVVGRPGNEYQVVVRNRRGEDLLAVVSVDGLNVLTGETASADQGGYIVGRRDRVAIKGWRKSLGEVAAFYFTSLGDSYAGRTGRPRNVGVIGAALFRRAPHQVPEASVGPLDDWPAKSRGDAPAEQPAPSTEGLAKRAAPRSESRALPSSPLGTGHGRREESHVRYAAFERATPEPAETIAIYYDSYRNLVARGILAPYAGPRNPHPFPAGFVPDP